MYLTEGLGHVLGKVLMPCRSCGHSAGPPSDSSKEICAFQTCHNYTKASRHGWDL